MKLKFSVVSLNSCNGCISTLVCLDVFLNLVKSAELVYFPFIEDSYPATIKEEEELQYSDVTLIEGCVTQNDEETLLKKLRKSSKKIIALGACAMFGGIESLSQKTRREPISKIIEIDGTIPGCPPPENVLGTSIISLIEGRALPETSKNLCAVCELRPKLEKFKTIHVDKLQPEKFPTNCFLDENVLCLGPVTREGCDAKCIKRGLPCEGCMGPPNGLDYTANVINFLSTLELSDNLRTYEGIIFRLRRPRT
jgi:F420-non-reducing hydrogenase small subunit